MKKEVGEEGIGLVLPRKRDMCWVLCLEAFISFLRVGISVEVAGEGFSRTFISFPYVPFLGHGLHRLIDGSVTGQGVLVIAIGSGNPPGFAAFLGLEQKYN